MEEIVFGHEIVRIIPVPMYPTRYCIVLVKNGQNEYETYRIHLDTLQKLLGRSILKVRQKRVHKHLVLEGS